MSIMHRDLKPENILMGFDEDNMIVKLCDFGSAKMVSKLNTPYIVSRFYRPPELVLSSTNYGTEIDI